MSTTQKTSNQDRNAANGRDANGTTGTMSRLKDTISSTIEAAEDRISSAATAAVDQASAFAEPMKDKAMEMAEQSKASGAEQIGRMAKAVHAAAEEIEKEVPQAAGYIHSAAEGLEQASSAIRNRSVGEMVDFVQEFARRNPAAFFGSSVLAGFVLSRFLKSTSDRKAGRSRPQPRTTSGQVRPAATSTHQPADTNKAVGGGSWNA